MDVHVDGTKRDPALPVRIVSLTPTLTEFVLALGLGERLVAVTDYCELPAGMDLPRLGGVSNPDRALLRSLNPDLVLLDRSVGGPHAPVGLEADLPIHAIAVRTVGDGVAQLADLARVLQAEAQAAPLLAQAQAAVDRAYQQQSGRRLRRVVVFTWRDPWLAIGGDTYADDLLRLCGAENIALRMPGRSPRAGLEAFMHYNPQVVLLAADPYPFAQEDLDSFWRFGDVPAVLRRAILIYDGRLLTRVSLRLPEAIATLTAAIHRS
jgi:ABC-type Fe3+-hydroxamate transport system substrate-binding protein